MHKSVIKANKGGWRLGEHAGADLGPRYMCTHRHMKSISPGSSPSASVSPGPGTHLLSEEWDHLGTDRTQALHNLSLGEKQQAGSDWRGTATSTIQPPAGLSICGADWLRRLGG